MIKHISQCARKFIVTLCLMGLSSCGTNPVTGKRELSLISEAQEINIGKENYVPSQQSQGGPYVADPKLSAYVKSVGIKLVKVSDRPNLPYDFVVLNNSVPNAWALPGGKIAVNRGLLTALHNEAELAAVLGHEIVHAAARHGAKTMERGLLLQAGASGLAQALGEQNNKGLIVGAATLGMSLITQKFSREAESEADKYGMIYMARAGYDPRAAVTLQKTFVKLAQAKNSHWFDGLFASHPPSQERVKANENTARKLGAQGVLREKEYHAAIDHLLQAKTAYAKYDEGQQALKDRKHSKALQLAIEAIAIEPNEALFYGLKGDALFSADKLKGAQQAYSEALKKNPQFFYFYLRRGQTDEKLNQPALAQQDFNASVKLLPTAYALDQLGNLHLQEGDKDKAHAAYQLAATSNSLAGQHAAASLAAIELPEQPDKYIKINPVLTTGGSVGVSIVNHAPISVGHLEIYVAIVNIYDVVLQHQTYTLRNVLEPGDKTLLDSKLFLPGQGKLDRVRLNIKHAEAVKENEQSN